MWKSHCVLSTQVTAHGGELSRFCSHTQRVVRNFSLSLADVRCSCLLIPSLNKQTESLSLPDAMPQRSEGARAENRQDWRAQSSTRMPATQKTSPVCCWCLGALWYVRVRIEQEEEGRNAFVQEAALSHVSQVGGWWLKLFSKLTLASQSGKVKPVPLLRCCRW